MSEIDLTQAAIAVGAVLVALIVLAMVLRRPRRRRGPVKLAAATRPDRDLLRAEFAIELRRVEVRAERLAEELRIARIEIARLQHQRFTPPGQQPARKEPPPQAPASGRIEPSLYAPPAVQEVSPDVADGRVAALQAELEAARQSAAAAAAEQRALAERLAGVERALTEARETADSRRIDAAAASFRATALNAELDQLKAFAPPAPKPEGNGAEAITLPPAAPVADEALPPAAEPPVPATIEEVEAALLRERLSDLAAEVAAVTATIEGRGGRIDALLADGAAPPGGVSAAATLADKIRRLRERTAT